MKVAVAEIRLYERPVRLRLPFRFGAVTLRAAPQAFVRLRLRLEDGREGWGQAAELLVPKWFDKNPELSNEDNAAQLRTALRLARGMYLAAGAATPFALHAAIDAALHDDCAGRGLAGLIASFGTALIDRAVLDALGRMQDASIFDLVADNVPGIDARTAPDLAGFALAPFLAGLAPAPAIAYRHTVGLLDAIRDDETAAADRVGDGLPESLEAVIARYHPRYFKLKLCGDKAADLDRLGRIAALLDAAAGDYRVTLDGNEQYGGAEPVLELLRAVAAAPALRRLDAAILYVEQPIARARALAEPVHALAALKPVALDESDSDIGAFPRGRALGYAGMSSKACKGVYRSLLNRARCAAWGAPHFMTAEDLTTQAGVAVQQDLALASLIGCEHVERNGHHYVDGFAGGTEAAAFLAAHPDLYRDDGGRVRLRIEDGRIALGSIRCPGFGAAAAPDWASLTDITEPS